MSTTATLVPGSDPAPWKPWSEFDQEWWRKAFAHKATTATASPEDADGLAAAFQLSPWSKERETFDWRFAMFLHDRGISFPDEQSREAVFAHAWERDRQVRGRA